MKFKLNKLILGFCLLLSYGLESLTFQTNAANTSDNKLNYLYDFLNKNGHKQMCSLLQNLMLDNVLNSFEYTLISPTDEAFQLIPFSIKHQLQNDKDYRLDFVRNHLINGRLFFNSLLNEQQIMVNALSNNRIHIAAYSNGFVVNGANLITADKQIGTTNNLAQFVDKPIYLHPTLNIIDYLSQNFKQMLRFIEISDLQNEFQNEKEKTILVPNDDAFRTLPWTILEKMYNNNTFLKYVLRSHILYGIHYSLKFQVDHLSFTTKAASGEKLTFKSKTLQNKSYIFINNVPILNPDILIKNGLLHEISKLILPKQFIDECNCMSKMQNTTNSNYQNNRLQNNAIVHKFSEPFIGKNNLNLLNRTDYLTTSSSIQLDDYFIKSTTFDLPFINRSKLILLSQNLNNNYFNLTSLKYKENPEIFYASKETFKPIVYYDETDSIYFTTSRPKTPISYHQNHNYFNPNYKINSTNLNLLNITRNPKSLFSNKNFTSGSKHYTAKSSELINHSFSSTYSPKRPIYDPFLPLNNKIILTTPYTPNYRLTKTRHLNYNLNPISTSEIHPNIYKNQINLIKTNNLKKSNYRRIVPVSKEKDFNSSFYFNKINYLISSHKYLNDLTTPPSIPYNPTRKPKSPSYLTRIRKVNFNKNLKQNSNLNLNQQILNSTLRLSNLNLKKTNHLDTKTSANNNFNQKINLPKLPSQYNRLVLPSNSNRSLTKIYLNNQKLIKNYSPITLFDVIRKPNLVINNQQIEFNFFDYLLNQTNLIPLLKGPGQITLFLFTNNAIQDLADYELEILGIKKNYNQSFYSIASKENRNVLGYLQTRTQFSRNIILSHISSVLVNPDSILNNIVVDTYSNSNIRLSRNKDKLFANSMPILASTTVSNGVAYVINNLVTHNATSFSEENLRQIYNKNFQFLNDKNINLKYRNPIQVLEDTPDGSFFTNLIKKSNYSQLLADSLDTFTMFMPENYAFNLLPSKAINLLKTSQIYINKFVANHIINANFSMNNLLVSPILLNLNNLPIKIQRSKDWLFLNNTSRIKKFNIPTSTGFIHIINNTLPADFDSFLNYPNSFNRRKPIFIEPTLEDQLIEICKSRDSNKFLNLFIEYNYIGQLQKLGRNFTLILPSDFGFYSLPVKVIEKLRSDQERMHSLLNYHLLDKLIDFKNLETNDRFYSISNSPLYYTNITKQNNVLISEEDSVDSNLAFALPFLIQPSFLSSYKKEKIKLTKNSTDLFQDIKQTSQELNSENLNIKLSLSGALIKDIKLIDFEFNSKKFFLELVFIDRVLYTPKSTIYDLIFGSPILTNLHELILITSLKDELDFNLNENEDSSLYKSNETNNLVHIVNQFKPKFNGYTLFAPSNKAFERLGIEIFEKLKKSPETAKAFLLRHLIKKPIFTSSISSNGTLIENFTKEHLTFQSNLDVITIEGVLTEFSDITTTNGVVHVIENVL